MQRRINIYNGEKEKGGGEREKHDVKTDNSIDPKVYDN